MQRPAGKADHCLDRHAGDRRAQRRSPSEQIVDVPGHQGFDAEGRLHLNFVHVDASLLKKP